MIKRGFYIIKDEFFEYVKDPNLKGNKEENRPHYYCFKEDEYDFYWMIPLSSRTLKYRKIIDKKMQKYNRCDILHIAKLDDGRESVFLIQDMFPVTEQFIEREYTINNSNMFITSDHTAKEIETKAKRVLKLLKRGIKLLPTQVNINNIINKLSKTETIYSNKILSSNYYNLSTKNNEINIVNKEKDIKI